MREKMKIICVLQNETCLICDSVTETRQTITDWIEEGYMREEIDVYTVSGRVDFTVTTWVKAEVNLGKGQVE